MEKSQGRRAMSEFRRQEEEVIGSLCRLGSRGVVSPKSQIEQEKRIRREIANSNERRRMQSINAGFQSLRVLLPQRDGEKMSKAAILQHTAEYIYQLEQEKTRLLSQHCNLKRLLQQNGITNFSDSDCSDSTSQAGGKMPLKRKRTVDSVESADEGIGMSPSHCERELISDLRYQLDREREMRKDIERRLQQVINEQDGNVHLMDDDRAEEEEEEEECSSGEGEGECDDEDYVIKEEVTEECVVTDDLPQDLSCGAVATVVTTSATCSPSATPLPTLPLSHVVPSPSETVTVISKPSVVVLPVHSVSIVAAQQLTPAPSPPRCHSPANCGGATSNSTTMLHSSAVTSRQNLDAIVEAIRHLEGDHMFQERRPNNSSANHQRQVQQKQQVSAASAVASALASAVAEQQEQLMAQAAQNGSHHQHQQQGTINRSETVIVRSIINHNTGSISNSVNNNSSSHHGSGKR